MEYALMILGGGPAGYVAALRAQTLLAKMGSKERILLVDDHPYLGGTCLNEGCIPSKTLLHKSLELPEGSSNLDAVWQKMQKGKEEVMKVLGSGVAYLMKGRSIDVAQGFGSAQMASKGQIEIKVTTKEGASESYFGKKLLIATGSKPIELSGISFDCERILSSTEALSLKKIPKKLAVLGAGVIGLELSSIFARMGSEVDVFELAAHSCGPIDREISKQLESSLAKQGLRFHFNTPIDLSSIQKEAKSVLFRAADKAYKFDSLLVAVGRKPFVKGCEALNLKLDAKGRIVVDGQFQTSCKGVYATGDVIDGPMLAHKASEEAMVAVEAMLGRSRKLQYVTIPSVVYTAPEIASVGLSEQMCQQNGIEVVVGKSVLKANSRARCSEHTEGLVKIVAHKKNHRILGVHILAEGASEMIAIASLCLAQKMKLSQLAHLPFAHPTMSEAIREAAWAALGEPLHH